MVAPVYLKPLAFDVPVFCAFFIVIVSFTVVLILDGKTQDVAGSKAGAVVHTSVEERMGVGVLDIQDLTRGCHVTRDALVRRDTELFLHTHTHTKSASK